MKDRIKKIQLSMHIKSSFLYSAALKALLKINGINKHQKILDYGCGAGQFVNELVKAGFSNARGFDPYLPKNIEADGKLYLCNNLSGLPNKYWDIITLNHVFEHIENPVELLNNLGNLMQPGGRLLLRFPVIDSYAFEKYQENWVQFDAPRHANLFTRKSIVLAVEKAGGYFVEDMYDDSFHFQFTGSELYLKKLSLNPAHNNRKKRLLSPDTYRYHFLAKKLNKLQKGDQIVIVLVKK